MIDATTILTIMVSMFFSHFICLTKNLKNHLNCLFHINVKNSTLDFKYKNKYDVERKAVAEFIELWVVF